MTHTGVVRKIDDLGRVVIPMEFRRTLKIKVGDSVEISIVNGNVTIAPTKPDPVVGLIAAARKVLTAATPSESHAAMIELDTLADEAEKGL